MEELAPTLPNSSSSFTCDSSSSSFTCDSSSTYDGTYDVFLSFRGEDTRSGFTGHLYHALRKKGIHTFIDDRLERGKEITQSLLKAIEKSRIAIIILSVNYASSTFCLEELVKIIECREQHEQLVLPIFYKVDPSDVRHLRGSYGDALAGYEAKFKNDPEKIQKLKSALQEVADLSGWHYKEGDKYEYEYIEKIVEEVSKEVNPMLLPVAKYPVGLKHRVQTVISLLHLESNEVVIIGIHGIGGIGKTTIACAVHNAIVNQFEGVCFLSDVRERSNKDGLTKLQEELLSELIGEKGREISNVKEGISRIKGRLYQKKVLLILDDVNSHKQLEALAGGINWFGLGSRIIITTRDKHLLDVYDVSRNYEAEELCFEEALELFSWNAFKKNKVDSRYANISECVTNYCNGLPLALEIIGSNMFNKTQEEWKSALDTYKDIPDEDIQSVLEVSYNDLQEIEKEIFLDIACFFNGYYLEVVESVLLNGRDYNPQYFIGVLVKKSLIKIDKEKKVKIHDLMAQMGKQIVRRQSPSNPESWSRLWSYKDIFCVIEDDKGTDKIEALVLNVPQEIEASMLNVPQEKKLVCWNGKGFKKMKNLKILIIENACFPCEPKYLPNNLRVIWWKNHPSLTLSSNFCWKNPAFHHLWGSVIRLVKPLKRLYYYSLTDLRLPFCNLRDDFLYQWLPRFPNLQYLDLRNNRFTILPKCTTECCSLKTLILDECKKLRRIKGIPPNIEHLSMVDCTLLTTSESSSKLLSQRLYYYSLTDLRLPFCNLRDDFLYQWFPRFPNLEYLDLRNNRFTILPKCTTECCSLKTLILDDCKKLRRIEGIPPNIEHLSTVDCKLLTTSESSSKLLSQNFHKDRGRHVIVPGSRTPEWLDHSQKGSSMSFCFRNELRRLALCYIGTAYNMNFRIFINGTLVLESNGKRLKESQTPCISILDVQEWGNAQRELALKENEWKFVSVSLLGGENIIGEMGVHVFMGKRGTDNFQFMDPINDDFVLNSRFSLQKKFCLFLDMQVYDTINSQNRVESFHRSLTNYACFVWCLLSNDIVQEAIMTMDAPTKVKVLMLEILGDYLPTCHNLFIKKLVNSPMCPICDTRVETIRHVFLQCPWTQPLWLGSGLHLNVSGNEDYWLRKAIFNIKNIYRNADRVTGLMGKICWAIWKARNEFVLSNKPVDPREVIMTAKAMPTCSPFIFVWSKHPVLVFTNTSTVPTNPDSSQAGPQEQQSSFNQVVTHLHFQNA